MDLQDNRGAEAGTPRVPTNLQSHLAIECGRRPSPADCGISPTTASATRSDDTGSIHAWTPSLPQTRKGILLPLISLCAPENLQSPIRRFDCTTVIRK